MNNSIAKFLSYIFHPLLIPTYVVFFLFIESNSIISNNLVFKLILGIVFICTFLIPVSLIPVLYLSSFIKSFEMSLRKERRFPLMFTSISFGFCYYLINRIYVPFPPQINLFLTAAFVSVLLATIINFKWKISLHAIGIGGAIAAFLMASLLFGASAIWHFIASIFIGAFVGSSRLQLQSHNVWQVFGGTLFGGIITVLVFLIF